MKATVNLEACALIEQHGGSSVLARLTGYGVQRINNWKTRGIPDAARVAFPHLFWPEQQTRVDVSVAKAGHPPFCEAA